MKLWNSEKKCTRKKRNASAMKMHGGHHLLTFHNKEVHCFGKWQTYECDEEEYNQKRKMTEINQNILNRKRQRNPAETWKRSTFDTVVRGEDQCDETHTPVPHWWGSLDKNVRAARVTWEIADNSEPNIEQSIPKMTVYGNKCKEQHISEVTGLAGIAFSVSKCNFLPSY